MGLFYDNNFMVGSRDLEWIQGTINVIISLLRWYIIVTNVVNYKSMMCQPVEIQSRMT